MIVYQCIRCLVTWECPDGNCDDGFLSHGLCLDCLRLGLTETYRNRQRKEGNPDCFGKAENYCDQEFCKYKKICVKDKP